MVGCQHAAIGMLQRQGDEFGGQLAIGDGTKLQLKGWFFYGAVGSAVQGAS
jgi:hypothetical protein